MIFTLYVVPEVSITARRFALQTRSIPSYVAFVKYKNQFHCLGKPCSMLRMRTGLHLHFDPFQFSFFPDHLGVGMHIFIRATEYLIGIY